MSQAATTPAPIVVDVTVNLTAIVRPEPDAGGYSASIPALPGCHTQGETLEEAKAMAKEAIELYLETLQDRGLPAPEDEDPNFFKSKVSVQLSREAV